MRSSHISSNLIAQRSSSRVRLPAWFSFLLIALLVFCVEATPAQKSAPAGIPPGSDDLEARVAAAEAARSTRDPAKVAAANRLVIAASLRELAKLKLLESDYAQSIQLYRDSLAYEETPSAHAELGFAEFQAGHLDKAIEQGNLAHAADPGNIAVDRLLASALDQNGEYAKAVEPFGRIAKAQPAIDNLYPLAECLLQIKTPEARQRANAVFEQMKETAGESGSLHVLMGRAYRDGGDINSAIREFRRAIAIDSHTPHAHYFLGLAQLFANDWKPTPAIEEDLKKEIENYPNDYLANYMLGVTTSGERKYDDSDKYLAAASRINPDSPDPYLYLGMNAFAEEKMDLAEAMMRRAIEKTGTDEARTNYQIRRAYVDMARILGQSGRMEESKIYAAKARELQNKTMIETQRKVSRMMADSGGSMGAAVVPLGKDQENQAAPAVSDKDNPLAHSRMTEEQLDAVRKRASAVQGALALAFNDLATSLAIQQRYTDALADYKRAEHWNATMPGLEKNLGLCAFRAKDYPEAARALSLAMQAGEDSPGVRGMLGLSCFATDNYADAARAFEPLGERGMKDGEIGYAWAASLAHIGETKKASEVLRAFESEPRSNDVLLLVGQLWTETGDFARAIATFESALKSDPALPRAHFYEGLAYLRWEHWPEAAAQFKNELSLFPGELDAMYHLGFVDQQQSKVDEALALYLKVIAADPDYANAQYEAGKIFEDRGQYGDAATHLEIAARLTPEKDYIHYQLQAAYRKLSRSADADRELAVYKDIKAKSRKRVADALQQKP
ncbi:MAG TPA: tetratricopeptide repeat protein [Terracidiphilus sp.]|jgi:tetratricopeptide (TPR) repeat protein|nr:tetratricopeptide repeat protein [Terracidiphilus sp.]